MLVFFYVCLEAFKSFLPIRFVRVPDKSKLIESLPP